MCFFSRGICNKYFIVLWVYYRPANCHRHAMYVGGRKSERKKNKFRFYVWTWRCRRESLMQSRLFCMDFTCRLSLFTRRILTRHKFFFLSSCTPVFVIDQKWVFRFYSVRMGTVRGLCHHLFAEWQWIVFFCVRQKWNLRKKFHVDVHRMYPFLDKREFLVKISSKN